MKGVERMCGIRKEEGLTLIEATVVLSVLTILAMVLIPAVANQISESRRAQAKSEVKTIADAILAFYSDSSFFPQTIDSVNGRLGVQFVDLLVSEGEIPKAPSQPVLIHNGQPVTVDVTGWITGSFDLLENQLTRNHPGYRNKGGPNAFGWNGPYLSTIGIHADPWGNRYMVNVRFLDPSPGIVDASGRVKPIVVVISAGPNGIIETPFIQPRTAVYEYGDDIAVSL
jgi:type II secretory pathway pseudopilin PulG